MDGRRKCLVDCCGRRCVPEIFIDAMTEWRAAIDERAAGRAMARRVRRDVK